MTSFVPLDAPLEPARLAELFTKVRRSTSQAAIRLGSRKSAAEGDRCLGLYREVGLVAAGNELYRTPHDQPHHQTLLSHSDVDSDAIAMRPIAFLHPASRADGLRDMLRINGLLPTGGLALARVDGKELVLFVDHLATANLDRSELRTTLVSAEVAASHCDAAELQPDPWFTRTIPTDVHVQIETHLFARGTGWIRSLEGREGLWSWVRLGDFAVVAQYDPAVGLLTVARELDSFVGRPRLETAERVLATNLTLLDCTIASLQDGERGVLAVLGRICCDDLDEPELDRLLNYLERVRASGNARRPAEDLLSILEAHRVRAPVPSGEPEAPTEHLANWQDKLRLGQMTDETGLELPATDLLTHAFVCGASGSGKTIVCKNLIEEAALAGIPSLVVDLKGDLSSLACVPSAASRDAVTEYLVSLYGEGAAIASDEVARHTTRMVDGYATQGINDESLRAYQDRIRYRILTPRSNLGVPMSLSPLERLDLGALDTSSGIIGNQRVHEMLEASLSSLVEHLKLPEGDTDTLVAALIQLLETAHHRNLPLKGIDGIQTLVHLLFAVHSHTQRVNFLPTECAIDERQAQKYARAMNARLGGTFRYWFDGHECSIDDLINVEDGRVPINIVNLSQLQSQSDQMYAIAQLNARVISWMSRQVGVQRPRLIYYIDEIAQSGGSGAIFPPHPYNPITKPGLTTLLKQGRAFGVSCLLATQNAKDIDYKGLGQCDTWIVGRIKTETDLDRLRMGLDSAQLDAVEGAENQLEDLVQEVASLDTGQFIIRTKTQGVTKYRQKWIRSFHERLSPEMLKNWVRAAEIPIERRIARAQERWNDGEPSHAIDLLQSVVADEPYFSRLAEAKLLLCEWLFRTEQWQRAAQDAADLREMVHSRPDFERVHYYEGMSLYCCNQLDGAKSALQRFLSTAKAGNGDLADQCREILQALQIRQDDYEGLAQTITEQPDPSPADEPKRSRILNFCRVMLKALVSWPSLRGKLDDATVIAEDHQGRLRYTRKADATVHDYVARIHARLGELPPYTLPSAWSPEERETIDRVHAMIAADDQARARQEDELRRILAQAEESIDRGRLSDASSDLDLARTLVLESGLLRQEFERALSLYRAESHQRRDSLRDWLQNMDPIEFELETAALFRRLGYQAQATKASGDGGVDVFAHYENRRYVIQCKRYRHTITPNLIREFATVIRNFDADHGIFVATSKFSEGCREEASIHDIRLIDLEELLHLYKGSVDREPAHSTSAGPEPLDDALEAVSRVLSAATTPLLAPEVASRAGLELKACQRALRSLIDDQEVAKEGRARGTRYSLVSKSANESIN